jgi:hypothetical protein
MDEDIRAIMDAVETPDVLKKICWPFTRPMKPKVLRKKLQKCSLRTQLLIQFFSVFCH